MNIIVKIILTMIMAVGGYFIMKDAYTDNIKPIQSADLKIIAYFFGLLLIVLGLSAIAILWFYI